MLLYSQRTKERDTSHNCADTYAKPQAMYSTA